MIISVCRSEGNLILELDKRNPVTLLVSAITIKESALLGKVAKDDEFYLGVLRDGDGELSQVHHITSGGPSRGIMALETETAPGEGTTVQVRGSPLANTLITHPPFNSSFIVQVTSLLPLLYHTLRRTRSHSWQHHNSTRYLRKKREMLLSRFSTTCSWPRVRMGSCSAERVRRPGHVSPLVPRLDLIGDCRLPKRPSGYSVARIPPAVFILITSHPLPSWHRTTASATNGDGQPDRGWRRSVTRRFIPIT